MPENEIEDFPKPSIKKRRIKDVVSVCPVCFHPTKYIPAVFGMPQHTCRNEECGWTGSIAVEVSVEDYTEFVEKQKLGSSNDKNSE